MLPTQARADRVRLVAAGFVAVLLVFLIVSSIFKYHAGVVRRIEAAADGSGAHLLLVAGILTPRFAAFVQAPPPPVGAWVILNGEPYVTHDGDVVIAEARTVAQLSVPPLAPAFRWPEAVHVFFAMHRLLALVLGMVMLAFNHKAAGPTGKMLLALLASSLVVAFLVFARTGLGVQLPKPVMPVLMVLGIAGAFGFAHRYASAGDALLGRVAIALLTIPLSQEVAANLAPFSLLAQLGAIAIPLLFPTAPIWILGAWLLAVGAHLL